MSQRDFKKLSKASVGWRVCYWTRAEVCAEECFSAGLMVLGVKEHHAHVAGPTNSDHDWEQTSVPRIQ